MASNYNTDLTGRVAIVTGSGASMGKASAEALAGAGAQVVLANRTLGRVEAVAAELNAKGQTAVARQLDLASEDSVRDVVDFAVRTFGRIDILHNNAADTSPELMAQDLSVAEADPDVWDKSFRINARGAMLITKHVIPEMIKVGRGSVIHTSSSSARIGDFYRPAYAASKAAMNALIRYVAVQYGRKNIRCNGINPGNMLTPASYKVAGPELIHRYHRHVLLPRTGLSSDIAGAVLFLASDLSSFITGQIISVDGGIVDHMGWVPDALEDMGMAQAPLSEKDLISGT